MKAVRRGIVARKMIFFVKKCSIVLEVSEKVLPLHSQSGRQPDSKANAEIAQLVEHNLAKVRVASSSLVFRSRKEKFARKAQVAEW